MPTATLASVIDASALAAFLFGEPEAEAINRRIAGKVLFAPTLLDYELASVCRTKLIRHPDQREALLTGLFQLSALPLERIAIVPDVLVATAQETGLSVYDAAYLSLARDLRVGLITLDKPLEKAYLRALRT